MIAANTERADPTRVTASDFLTGVLAVGAVGFDVPGEDDIGAAAIGSTNF